MPTLRARVRALVASIEVLDVFLVVCLAILAYGLNLIHPALPFVVIGGMGVAAWAQIGSRPG